METPVLDATNAAIAAADHLDKTGLDAGQIEAVKALARKIDAWDVICQYALDDAAEHDRARPAVPQNDNVSIASYMKGMASLGLTPEARNTIPRKADAPAPTKKRGGALASVSNIPRPAGS